MKRPQFGLKLILLITVLAAILLAWFRLRGEVRKGEWERDTIVLRNERERYERQRAEIEKLRKDIDPNDKQRQALWQKEIDGVNGVIDAIQAEIDAAKK